MNASDAWDAACRVLERLESLESLSLAANGLTSLPPALFALKQLRTLDVSKNCLAEVQPEIAALKSLQARSIVQGAVSGHYRIMQELLPQS